MSAHPTAPALGHAQAAPINPKLAAAIAQLRHQHVIYTRNGRFGPFGADPTKALVPDAAKVDWGGWRRDAKARAKTAAKQRATAQRAARLKAGLAAAPTPRYVKEDEVVGTRGGNDTFGTAQVLAGFGTGSKSHPAYTVLGHLSPAPVPAPLTQVAPGAEPNDTAATAQDTGVSQTYAGVRTTGYIGDNQPSPDDPQATDVDFLKVTLKAGEQVSAAVKRTTGDLVPGTALVDGDGNLLQFGDDDFESSSSLAKTVRKAGTYYVIVLGWTFIDLGTGAVTVTKGDYDATLYARAGDRDLYRVSLQAGDVLGAAVTDKAAYVSVFDAKGVEVHGSGQDASSAYPQDSPLPGGGNAVTDYVAPRTGTYYVEVTDGDGAYTAQLEAYRYGGAAKKQTQTIFLDTDGQRLNTGPLGGRGVTTLSPLRSFLGGWGLKRTDEKVLIGKIKSTVQENLDADLRKSGLSKYVSVKVVTSLDGKDPWGSAGVTRVIVGGTIAESGISTIGIASSIDPGNFNRTDTALALLDVLSGDPAVWGEASLNNYLKPGSNRLDFVGHAVGNVVSHEVGHTIGNWHTDNADTKANLMDAGGENFALLFGVGKDGIGGTADDPDVDFGQDAFIPAEGFTGVEDTLSNSVWGMSTKP